MNRLSEIVEFNCSVLGVDIPKVQISPASFFPTPTTRAQIEYSKKATILHVNEKYLEFFQDDKFQAWLAISHEIRHIWQIQQKKLAQSLKKYERSDKRSMQEYNDQDLEIDAWAWATIVVNEKLQLRPLFSKTLGKEIEEKIFGRVVEILNELK